MTHPLLEALQVNEAQFIALRRQFHQQHFLLPKQCDLVDSDSDVAIKKQPRNA